MKPAIDLAVTHDAWNAAGDLDRLAGDAIGAALRVGGATEALDGAEVSLLLCDDAFIRTLNRQWRGQDKPTNVLSFPAPPAMRSHALGDIAVAFETSAREAAERGVALGEHLVHLVVHGTLHLLDYDHGDEAEAERMEGLEARALASLGLASPFLGELIEPAPAPAAPRSDPRPLP